VHKGIAIHKFPYYFLIVATPHQHSLEKTIQFAFLFATMRSLTGENKEKRREIMGKEEEEDEKEV
jgi:hypothetical protein